MILKQRSNIRLYPAFKIINLHSTNSVNSTSLLTCFFLQISLTNTMDQLPEKVPDLLVRQGIVILAT